MRFQNHGRAGVVWMPRAPVAGAAAGERERDWRARRSDAAVVVDEGEGKEHDGGARAEEAAAGWFG